MALDQLPEKETSVTGYGDWTATWRKSSWSEDQSCVQARWVIDQRSVLVRDSADAAGPHLRVSLDSWTSFIQVVKAGDLDIVH